MRSTTTPATRSITSRLVEGTLQFVARRGGAPERVRAHAKLPTLPRGGEALLETEAIARLLECAAEELGEDHLGLRLGAALDLRVMGTISYVVANAPSIGTALANLVRYQSSFTRGFDCFYESGPVVSVGFRLGETHRAGLGHLGEFCVAIVARTMRSLIGDRWGAVAVRFEHEPFGGPALYRRVFGCDAAFGHHRTELAITASTAEELIPYADRQLLPVVERRLKTYSVSEDPLLHTLRSEIAHSLCDGTPGVDMIATRMRLSTRTLQRRLRAQRTSFRQLLVEVRKQLADQYLHAPHTDLLEVALLLGYADLSAFDHAFRSWYGESPSSYRLREWSTPGARGARQGVDRQTGTSRRGQLS